MSFNQNDYVARLQRDLQDVGDFLQPDDVTTFLRQAVLIYSKDRPLIKIHEITGDGTSFDFAMPSDWLENFSSINGDIEYPVDDSIQQQSLLDRNDWKIIRKLVSTTTTLYLRFLSIIPANTKKARFEYMTQHTLSTATSTVKDGDYEAVISMAASLCYWALASRFAQSSDSTISADVIDYSRKSDIYTDLAKEKMNTYRTMMGLGEQAKNKTAASVGIVVKDLDMQYPGSIGDYLTHPSSTR
jgi:hypothetical protein